jgi:hypothetical protein
MRLPAGLSAFLKGWTVTLHGLHASHMLASNSHPKVVQESGALLDRDHDGLLQAPDAEHAGRTCRGG